MRARRPPRDEYADTLLQPETSRTKPATDVRQRMNTKNNEEDEPKRSEHRPDQKTSIKDTPKRGRIMNSKDDFNGNRKSFESSLNTSMNGCSQPNKDHLLGPTRS